MNPEQFKIFRKTSNFNKELYDLGRIAEIEVLEKLRIFFNDESINHLTEGHSFDYLGKNKYIELKSRRVNRLTYEDTAIGIKKINLAKEGIDDYYFVFKYINGLFYWKYNKDQELRKGMLNNISHYFIPVNILIKIL